MKLSIILTHYSTDDFKSENGRKCIESVKKTLNDDCELIIVNNGDRDDFSDIANLYIKNFKNSLGGARNLGFSKCSGDYICFIDNDVIPEQGWWEECIELLEKYPDRKLIASPVHSKGHMRVKFKRGMLGDNMLNTRAGSNCLVMSRKTFEDIGLFWENPASGDVKGMYASSVDGVEFCNRQYKKGYLVILTRRPMAIDIGSISYKYLK